METFCLAPAALFTFLQMLSPDIIEVVDETTVIVQAEEGPVEWIFIERLQLFAVDGNIGYCVPSVDA